MSSISLSTGWLPRLIERPFYELSSVIKVMNQFSEQSGVDGFEFALLPEWDSETAPLTPTSAPSSCEKHMMQEILEILNYQGFSILSVHANRDVGSYLCSRRPRKIAKGIKLIDESLRFTQSLKSRICVFHFWDPWKDGLDLAFLHRVYDEFQDKYPQIEISIENIPTVNRHASPYQLMQAFRHKTLDLKWVSLTDEFGRFAETIGQVDNVHIQGKYENGILVPTVGVLNYQTALKRIKEAGYNGVFTIELEGQANHDEMLTCIGKFRKCLE